MRVGDCVRALPLLNPGRLQVSCSVRVGSYTRNLLSLKLINIVQSRQVGGDMGDIF